MTSQRVAHFHLFFFFNFLFGAIVLWVPWQEASGFYLLQENTLSPRVLLPHNILTVTADGKEIDFSEFTS